MRLLRPALAGLALVGLALTGCTAGAGAAPGPTAPLRYPAAAAGGACQLLDYEQINAIVGVRFDTAGASKAGETYTCAVKRAGAAFPDLTLSVTATTVDTTIFKTAVQPSGAPAVAELGKIGYVVQIAASGALGPRWEVGWLSGNQRLMVLRFTFAKEASDDDVAALKPKMVELAKKIDFTNV